MKAQIVRIGNSQGIRIPKVLLEEARIAGDVDLEVLPEGILIRNIKKPRRDWDERFKAVADVDDDQPIDARGATNFQRKEWQW